MKNQHDEIKNYLKEKLLDHMSHLGMSQGQLANIMGVDRRVVNRQLNAGYENLSIDHLIKMHNAIGLKVTISVSRF